MEIKNPESVSHFPNEIPLDVKNTRFCFVPPFLQGDGHIELSFQTSPEKIQVYYDKFKKIETYSQQDYSSSFYTSKDDEIRWDVKKDLERMYFQPDPQNTQEHEPEYGVAINKNENTIIFWAQW